MMAYRRSFLRVGAHIGTPALRSGGWLHIDLPPARVPAKCLDPIRQSTSRRAVTLSARCGQEPSVRSSLSRGLLLTGFNLGTDRLVSKSASIVPVHPWGQREYHSLGTSIFGSSAGAQKMQVACLRPGSSTMGIGGCRQLSTRLPRSMGEKIFAAGVLLVLAAWGLLFGAVTLLLLPFVALGFYLMRNKLRTGGGLRSPLSGLGRDFPARGALSRILGTARNNVGPMGMLVSALAPIISRVLSGSLSGLALVPKIQREVTERFIRHPELSRALGGGITAFPSVNVSMGAMSAGGSPSTTPASSVRARLRVVGHNGAGAWVDVDAEEDKATEKLVFDRMVVTLDNGRPFDLVNEDFKEKTRIFTSKTSRSSRGRGGGGRDEGGPVEAEFRDK